MSKFFVELHYTLTQQFIRLKVSSPVNVASESSNESHLRVHFMQRRRVIRAWIKASPNSRLTFIYLKGHLRCTGMLSKVSEIRRRCHHHSILLNQKEMNLKKRNSRLKACVKTDDQENPNWIERTISRVRTEQHESDPTTKSDEKANDSDD